MNMTLPSSFYLCLLRARNSRQPLPTGCGCRAEPGPRGARRQPPRSRCISLRRPGAPQRRRAVGHAGRWGAAPHGARKKAGAWGYAASLAPWGVERSPLASVLVQLIIATLPPQIVSRPFRRNRKNAHNPPLRLSCNSVRKVNISAGLSQGLSKVGSLWKGIRLHPPGFPPPCRGTRAGSARE